MDLPTLLLSYGVELRARGKEYIAKCIAHNDGNNPNLSVYRNGNDIWRAHCFSCGFDQGIVGVYCKLNGLDPENKEHLALAIKALDDPTFGGGQKYATIKDDPHAIQEKRKPRTMLTPPAADAIPRMNYIKDRDTGEPYGDPVAYWTFNNADGVADMYEARYIFKGRKEPRVFSYGQRGVAKPKWECAHYEGQRPIYARDRISDCVQVAIFEGCRKAAKAQELLDAAGLQVVACTAWTGGALAWHKSDWSPIYGKTVLLFPDHDEPGFRAMNNLARELTKNSCTLLKVEDTDKDSGWDICDQEWTPDEFAAWAKAHKKEWIDAKPDSETVHGTSKADATQQAPHVVKDDDAAPASDNVPPSNTDPIPVYAYDIDNDTEFSDINWPEPGDVFSEIQSPRLNPDHFPDSFRDFIMDTAGVKGVDPCIVGLSALVSAAACLHDDIMLQPERTNPSWKESARLWGAIVGSSGIKKSAGIKSAVSRLKKIQIDLSEAAIDLETEYTIKQKCYEEAQKDHIKALMKGDTASIKPLKPVMPEIPRLWFEDVTVEKLSDSLKASRRGCIVLHDELSGFFASQNQYKGGIGGDPAAYLSFYEGGPRYTDRLNRGSIFTPNFGGCLLGGIQPSVIQKITQSMPEDGMLQRFMVVNARQGTEGNQQPYNKAASDRYHNILQHLFDTLPHPDPVNLSPEANEIRLEVTRYAFKLIEAKLVSTGLCSWLSKWEGLFARLALTYHAIECAELSVHPQSCDVSERSAGRVRNLILDYLLPHAIAFYINIQGGGTMGHAVRKIAELCLTRETNDIATRDISTGWIGWRHYKPWEQEQALNILIEQGWIMPHPKARRSSKGFPTRYLVNPQCKVLQADRVIDELERRKIAAEAINKCKAVHGD